MDGSHVCCVSYAFVTCPYSVLRKEWHLIESVPGLCLPLDFYVIHFTNRQIAHLYHISFIFLESH